MIALHCEQLAHEFASPRGNVLALDAINLRVEANELVCLIGPSGCGKTTLLKIIAGLLKPTRGRVILNPAATDTGLPTALVFQEHGIFPWLNVLENVAFGLEMRGVGREERTTLARAFLERIGLGEFTEKFPHELSVGMRQRVGVARAFVSDAPILLMDEPFGALDTQTKRVLQTELLRIWQNDAKTIVFVTHDLDEAVRLGDRIVLMSARPGQIAAEIQIPLARPRDGTLTQETALTEWKWRISNMLNPKR